MKDRLRTEFPIRAFTWNAKDRKLSAFASDLGKEWLQRVWLDAADLGLKIKGSISTKLFTLVNAEHKDGEIVAWHLREHTRSKLSWTLVVFND